MTAKRRPDAAMMDKHKPPLPTRVVKLEVPLKNWRRSRKQWDGQCIGCDGRECEAPELCWPSNHCFYNGTTEPLVARPTQTVLMVPKADLDVALTAMNSTELQQLSATGSLVAGLKAVCEAADVGAGGWVSTARIREALACSPSSSAVTDVAQPVAESDEQYENEHPAARRMRLEFEAKYGRAAPLVRAANHWFNVRSQWGDAWNRDREEPVTENDVAEAERAMLASALSLTSAVVRQEERTDRRAEFEAWVRTMPGGTDAALYRRDFQDSDRRGQYVSPQVEFAWQALCAFQAAPVEDPSTLRTRLSVCDRVIEQRGGVGPGQAPLDAATDSSQGPSERADRLDLERLGVPSLESELRFMHEHHPLMNEGYKGSTLWHRVEAALSGGQLGGDTQQALNTVEKESAIAASAPKPAAATDEYGEEAGGARALLLSSTPPPAEALRLMTMLLGAFGSRHPAVDDLVALVLKAASSAGTPHEATITWPKSRDVGRIGDMSPIASMRVGFDGDNDVYVSICDESGSGSIEFCTPGAGGGKSSKTRLALIALMVAMEADNAADTSRDWWRRRGVRGDETKGVE